MRTTSLIAVAALTLLGGGEGVLRPQVARLAPRNPRVTARHELALDDARRGLATFAAGLCLALAPGAATVGQPAGPLSPPAALALSGPAVKSSDSGVGLYVNKDGNSILRLTLPKIAQLPQLSYAQELVETIKLRFDQVGYKRDPVWIQAAQDAGILERTVQQLRPEVLENAPPSVKADAEAILNRIEPNLRPLQAALREKDIQGTLKLQSTVAKDIEQLQVALLPKGELPYELPAEYGDLAQLRGRATVEMKLAKGKGNKNRFCASTGSMYTGRFGLSYSEMKDEDEDRKGVECAPENTAAEVSIKMVLDGYHAPLTAGNFAKLVKQGYYDNMPIQQLTDLTVQTGDGSKAGKPKTNKIPLELFYKRDSKPSYSFTSDEDRRGAETMALPFQSYGALGMARDSADLGGEIDNDSATSTFFFVKYDQALIPPGRNTLDGAYSCFGYTSEGAVYLKNLEEGDTIVSAKIIKGEENLKLPNGGK